MVTPTALLLLLQEPRDQRPTARILKWQVQPADIPDYSRGHWTVGRATACSCHNPSSQACGRGTAGWIVGGRGLCGVYKLATAQPRATRDGVLMTWSLREAALGSSVFKIVNFSEPTNLQKWWCRETSEWWKWIIYGNGAEVVKIFCPQQHSCQLACSIWQT